LDRNECEEAAVGLHCEYSIWPKTEQRVHISEAPGRSQFGIDLVQAPNWTAMDRNECEEAEQRHAKQCRIHCEYLTWRKAPETHNGSDPWQLCCDDLRWDIESIFRSIESQSVQSDRLRSPCDADSAFHILKTAFPDNIREQLTF
jgi:hypothetical protein